MNGRLYDPLLRRFLNADENIQDPHNTQNYNKYGYVLNNPLMYNDPSGEFFAFLGLGVLFWKAVIIGATVGLASYTVGLAVTGNLHQWNIGGALKATFFGAVGGAASFGVGSLFSVAGEGGKMVATALAESIKKVAGGVGLSIVQAGTHAISQGVLSVMQGGSFEQAFWSGALGSLGASAFGAVAGDFGKSTVGTVAFGALSGGIGAELSGGNFWEGAVIGGVVAGLNHAMHRESSAPPEKSLLDTAGEWITDYFDYNGDGQIAGWDYALGVADIGITIFDIVTIPSGEGVAAHLALKGGARAVAKNTTKTLSKQEIKSIKTYKKLIIEHQSKLTKYSINPSKYDNTGILKNAPTQQIRNNIIESRKQHLKHEIKTFHKNINNILNKK